LRYSCGHVSTKKNVRGIKDAAASPPSQLRSSRYIRYRDNIGYPRYGERYDIGDNQYSSNNLSYCPINRFLESVPTLKRMSVSKRTRFRVTASGEPVLVTPDSGASDADSGENSGELDTGEPDAAEQEKESPSAAQHKVLLGPKDYKRLKHGKDAPFDAELQYLKPQPEAQALVHHKFVMDLPDCIWIDEKTGKTAPCLVMAVKAYSSTQAKFWYVDFTIISHANRCDLQLPVQRGTVKSVNHAMNLQELFRHLFNHLSTLEDLGITEECSKQIMSATIDAWRDSLQNPFTLACVLSLQINAADARRKEQEQAAAVTRSAVIERKALEEARARGPPTGHFKQVMETCEPLDTI
jgi:hypothetical protein